MSNNLIIETVDEVRGDGKATGRKVVRIGRAEDVKAGNIRKMIVLGPDKCGMMLDILDRIDNADILRGQCRENVAAKDEVVRPTATLEWGGDTYGLFGTRIVKRMVIRKDRPDKPHWRTVKEDCPIRPAHFTGGAALPAIPEKGTPGRKAGSHNNGPTVKDEINELKAMLAQLIAAKA